MKTLHEIFLDKLKRECPECGSGDVGWCNISLRAYCNECGFWNVVNHGNMSDGIMSWNNRLETATKQ